MRKSLHSNLARSLEQEEKKIKDKFNRADLYLNSSQASKKEDEKNITIYEENKLVREGISLPKKETALVENLRGRLTKPGFYPTKSEIFRAGILALSSLMDDQIESLLNSLEKLKPGRKKPV